MSAVATILDPCRPSRSRGCGWWPSAWSGPPEPEAAAVVRHLTCVQAQDWPGSCVSIALRSADRAVAGVHAAYDSGAVVRSWPMRGTLHAVPAQDRGWMLALTGARMVRRGERTRAELGLTASVLDDVETVARGVLRGGGLSRDELAQRWRDAGLDVSGQRAYHCLSWLAMRGVVCLGPVVGAAQQVVLCEEWITAPRHLAGQEAVAHWLHRYVLSHGPVAPSEFSWWTKLLRRDIAPELDAVRETVLTVAVDGRELWMAPDLPERYAAAPGERRTAAAAARLRRDAARLRRSLRDADQGRGAAPGAWRQRHVPAERAAPRPRRRHLAPPARAGEPVRVTPFTDVPAVVRTALPRLTRRLPV